MIVDAPGNPEQTKDPSWQKRSCLFRLLEGAEAQVTDHLEWELVRNYWMNERPALPSKTRETVDADFTGMFDPLTRG